MIIVFKRKTAYEMRISDWSSDVCSSDLLARLVHALLRFARERLHAHRVAERIGQLAPHRLQRVAGGAAAELVGLGQQHVRGQAAGSEGRRGGKESVRTHRSRRPP